MINWILEVDDVEDVACIVDEMDAIDRSGSLAERGWSEGRGGQGYKGRKVQATQGCGVPRSERPAVLWASNNSCQVSSYRLPRKLRGLAGPTVIYDAYSILVKRWSCSCGTKSTPPPGCFELIEGFIAPHPCGFRLLDLGTSSSLSASLDLRLTV